MKNIFEGILKNLDDIPFDNYPDFLNAITDQESKVQLSKDMLSVDNGTHKLESLNSLPDGQISIDVSGTVFDCFVHRTESPELIVFLSGVTTKYTKYQRWSWNSNISVIAIADPMYSKFGLNLGWYYGTPDTDYRLCVSSILKRVSLLWKIPFKNITIYGSSGGGCAALHVGSLCGGCTVVAINPQFDIKTWNSGKDYAMLKQTTSIDADNDRFQRNDLLSRLNTDRRSRFFILMNAASEEDMSNLKSFADNFSVQLQYGLSIYKNICFWIYHAYPKPGINNKLSTHASQEYPSLFSLIYPLVHDKNISNDKVLSVNYLWRDISWLHYRLFLEQIIAEAKVGNSSAQQKILNLYCPDLKIDPGLLQDWIINAIVSGDKSVLFRFLRDRFGLEKFNYDRLIEVLNSVDTVESFYALSKIFSSLPEEKSVDRAIDLMRKAADKNPPLVSELVSLLLIRGTDEDCTEAFKILCSISE